MDTLGPLLQSFVALLIHVFGLIIQFVVYLLSFFLALAHALLNILHLG